MGKVSSRIWSFQSRLFVDKLDLESVGTPDWQALTPSIQLAYKWMANQLSLKTAYQTDSPPIWAWSKFEDSVKPNLEAGKQLLSHDELSRGVVLIELNVPTALLLHSCYETWNQFLDLVIDQGTVPDDLEWLQMFSRETIHSSPTIQAVLPFIEKDWIVSISEI